MWNRLRLVLVITLSLGIAGTSGAAATHVGVHDVQGQFVICTGQGVITLYVDANGEPIEPDLAAQNCPDCVLLTLDLFAFAEGGMAFTVPRQIAPHLRFKRSVEKVFRRFAVARAPPSLL